MNITKFGAFVNILPGRDGLIHISKLGRGKRIDRVEDVLSLGDELTVRVDDIDQNGKLSLSLVGDDDGEAATAAATAATAASADGRTVRARRASRATARDRRRQCAPRDRVVRGVLGRPGPRGVRRPRPGRGARSGAGGRAVATRRWPGWSRRAWRRRRWPRRGAASPLPVTR